ncbi:MAG: TonB-dependent receptor [Bacteroidales bacterium]|nr:TonB-dependent receptor [Bacteroidales bacterium]
MKKIATLILSMGLSLAAWAQNVTVSGHVLDNASQPVIGAFVVEKGTSNGTMTGAEGEFAIKVPAGAALEVSCIGYQSRTVTVTGETPDLTVILEDDSQMLEETVVIGYGVQKKSVVTASIAKVSAEDLGVTAPTRVDNALKGLTAGVNVTASSGQPGASSRIRVRGTGTINHSDPLYIVDGMPIEGGIDYLNPTDIESIEVLKDAASGAVYGARAANGVILVTTKKGVKGQTRVTYDFSYGISNPWRMREVLNASEYALMINEGLINAGIAPKYNDPFSYGVGTDWQKEVFNRNAPQQTHEMSVSGASDKINYYLSLGYTEQEGIVGGNFNKSNYDRLTLRSNTSYTLLDKKDERNFLNCVVLSSNLSYANIHSIGVTANSQWGSPLGSALALSPILGVIATEEQAKRYASLYAGETLVTDPSGRLYMIPGMDYNEMVNPIASMSLPGNKGWSHKFVAGFAGEIQIWDNLKFRSSYGIDLSFWGNEGYTPLFYLSGNNKATYSNANGYSATSTVWQIENTLTYNKEIGRHGFSVLFGQSAKASAGKEIGGSRYDLPEEWYGKPYINNATGLQEDGRMSVYGGPYISARLASYFFRADYNFDERYMAQFTIRRDGSSRFGANNKWATFPSFSLGWNLHKESFFRDNIPAWINNAKIRFSWGKNGNEAIGDFRYTVLTSSENNYILGEGETTVQGVKSSGLANPNLRWEESVQTDLGLDLGFFNNQLTFTVDWYDKKTDGMLMEIPINKYVGEARPIGNVGIMDNRGVEMEAGFKHSVGDWNFRLGGNLTYLRNTLINLGNESGIANYDSFQGAGTITRAENGKPFPFFFGYKTDGIFQNQAEIDSYVGTSGAKIMPAAVPGDVRFVDVNGDGKISDDDRTFIGNGTPDWTWGVNFSASWRNFDFYMLWQGTVGNDIFDATRRTDISETNLPAYMLNRWTGEGTSNKYPRFVRGDSVNWQSSDLYIQDGTYGRLKNIQLGYTLPERLTRTVFVSSLRLYVSAENLLTMTSYRGYDPEISSGGTSLGVDYGVYPQARTFLFGINLKF